MKMIEVCGYYINPKHIKYIRAAPHNKNCTIIDVGGKSVVMVCEPLKSILKVLQLAKCPG